LHQEVRDAVRKRLVSVDEAKASAAGMRIAEQIARSALDHFPGVYLITPFLRYETTVGLAKFARNV
jgi:hypothetical protein